MDITINNYPLKCYYAVIKGKKPHDFQYYTGRYKVVARNKEIAIAQATLLFQDKYPDKNMIVFAKADILYEVKGYPDDKRLGIEVKNEK